MFYELLVQVTPTCTPHKLTSDGFARPAQGVPLVAPANVMLSGSEAFVQCEESDVSAEGVYIITISQPMQTELKQIEVHGSPEDCPTNCKVIDDVVLLTVLFEKIERPEFDQSFPQILKNSMLDTRYDGHNNSKLTEDNNQY
jgi:hypothetical protein